MAAALSKPLPAAQPFPLLSPPLSSPLDRPAGDGAGRLDGLRRMLADKFPEAERKARGGWATGIVSLDALEGGLRYGAVTELTATPGNGALFIHGLLQRTLETKSFAALIDAGGTFDPDSCPEAVLTRLLWVRCPDAIPAVKAADILLRDGNLPLLLLDFQMITPLQMGKIPASTWHRFQRLVEQTALIFVVLTRQPAVESAQVRISLHNRWTLEARRHSRAELIAALAARVIPRRTAGPSLLRSVPASAVSAGPSA